MELITEPDTYSPSIDDNGNYFDKIPPSSSIKRGLRCPCGARRDKVYDTHSMFAQHCKTKMHQKWLEQLNLNKANYFVENEKLKDTVFQQRLIIEKLQKEIRENSVIMDYLKRELLESKNSSTKVVNNLLDFD